MHNIKAGILLIFLVLSASLTAKETLSENLEMDGEFVLETDQERVVNDYYKLALDLDFLYDAPKKWKIGLDMELAPDQIEVEELWVRKKWKNRTMRLGSFENNLLLEQKMSGKFYPYVSDSLLLNRLEEMGWLSDRTAGISYSTDISRAHLFFQPSGREAQFNGEFYYPILGEDSYLGGTLGYYNYASHRIWIGDNSYTQDHNFLISLALGDEREEKKIHYRLEGLLAQNLIDPVGYIHFPGEGEVSFFTGGDLTLSYRIAIRELLWIPSLDCAFLLPDLNHPEAWNALFRTGQLWGWDDTFFLRLEWGVALHTYYEEYDRDDPELLTTPEVVWGVSFQIRL